MDRLKVGHHSIPRRCDGMRWRLDMVAILNPFIPLPSEEQRRALSLASLYLKRAATQAATRLMALECGDLRAVEAGDFCEGLERAAVLLESISEVRDGWPLGDS
jgi:hypothetical protein